jgi:hypothetical protein
MVKLLASADVTASPKKSQVGLFLGDHHAMIQTMVAVKSSCLAIYHSFQLKEIHQICIGKEGNLWQIKHKTIRSDQVNLIFAGFNFYVYTTYSLQSGWKIKAHATEKGRYKRTRNQTHVT